MPSTLLFNVLIIAIIVVLVVLLIYGIVHDKQWTKVSYWKANYLERPNDIIRRSNGTFDEAARIAYNRIRERPNPTPHDQFLAANIINYNMLGQYAAEVPDRRDRFIEARDRYHAALAANDTYVIDIALDFAIGGAAAVAANAGGYIDLWELDFIIDEPLIQHAHQTHDHIIADRRQAAAAAPNPTAAYMDMAVQHTNDPQSTHDSAVLAALRGTVDTLREETVEITAPTPFRNYVAANAKKLSDNRDHKVQDVYKVLDHEPGYVVALGATDRDCLDLVWRRAHDSRNAANFELLAQALFDALYDCWEDGIVGRHIVCANGRATRILASLSLLDFNEQSWQIKRLEQHKNDIFEAAQKLITDIATAEGGPAGQQFLSTTTISAAPEAEVAALEAKIRGAISGMVDEYAATHKSFPAHLVEMVKKEACAAL